MFIALPFGQTIIYEPYAVECPMMLVNILWLITLGFPIAAYHLSAAFICFITIIGIPFAWQHFRFAVLALWPFGADTGFLEESAPPGEAPPPIVVGQPVAI